jgi:hypothetical protein
LFTIGDLAVNGEIDLNEGSVVADSLTLLFGEMSGVGLVVADVTSAGYVAPGLSAGELRISGTYVQTALGVLRAELGNHAASEWDRLTISGAASLGGTLEFTTLPTFSAPSGATFTILTFASRTGTFASVTVNGEPIAGSGFSIDYNATNVTIKALGATDAPLAAGGASSFELIGRRTPSGSVLELALPVESDVRLSLFDVSGREVAVLREGRTAAGRHPFELANGFRPVASGIYFGRAVLSRGGYSETRTARVPVIR